MRAAERLSQRAMACNVPRDDRQRWQRRAFRICNLQIPLEAGWFESHSLRQLIHSKHAGYTTELHALRTESGTSTHCEPPSPRYQQLTAARAFARAMEWCE